MRSIFGALLVASVAAASARADDGCTKDTDCKGDRICFRRECVDPGSVPPPPPADNTVPASFSPPPPAPAPHPTAPAALDTRHRHLGGFIRPDIGFGYHEMRTSSGGVDMKFSGFAGTIGFAAGGAITENSILAVHLWDTAITDPKVSSGGASGTASDTTLSLVAIGPQYTLYTRDNFYFSLTPSLSRVNLRSNGVSGDTNWGFGLRTAVGKEWWVGDHWGLGVVGHLSFSVNQDSGSNPPTWTGWGTTIAFTATYN